MKKMIGVLLMLGVLLALSVGVVQAQTGVDTDGDGYLDELDNCPLNHNVHQEDADQDGIGDACEAADPTGVRSGAYLIKMDCSLMFPELADVYGANYWACLMMLRGAVA